MSDETWGPWIEHDGKGCPCVGQYTEWVCDRPANFDTNPHGTLIRGGMAGRGFPSGGPSWFWEVPWVRIIRYRIRKPRALQTLIEIAANPAPMPEEVEA